MCQAVDIWLYMYEVSDVLHVRNRFPVINPNHQPLHVTVTPLLHTDAFLVL
jgi:hypothetical protein